MIKCEGVFESYLKCKKYNEVSTHKNLSYLTDKYTFLGDGGKVEHLFNITNEELHRILQSRSEDSFSYVEAYKSHMCIT